MMRQLFLLLCSSSRLAFPEPSGWYASRKKTFFHPLEPNVVDEFFVSMQSRTKMHFNLMPNFIPIWKFSAALTFDVTRSAANQGDCTNTWTWLTMQTSAYHVEKSISDGSTQRRAERRETRFSLLHPNKRDKRGEELSLLPLIFVRNRARSWSTRGCVNSKTKLCVKAEYEILLELL